MQRPITNTLFPGWCRQIAIVLTVIAATGSWSDASAQVDLDAIRDLVADDLQEVQIGAGYAAIVDFAISRDITSATFYPDEVEGVTDPRISNTKLPFRMMFGADDAKVRPFLQGHLAFQVMKADFSILADESVRSEWTTLGGSASGGFEVAVGEFLTVLPVVSVGYGRMENEARYSGQVGQDVLQPVFSNLLFDWDVNALVYGASLGLDYRRQYGRIDLEILGNLTHHQVESSSASTPFAEFDGHVSAIDVEANVVLPTSWRLVGHPLALVGLFGATGILGPDGDALGFDRFFEAGLGLEGDVSSRGWKVKSLRFGLKAIFGPDVTGYGLILGYAF